AQRAAFVGGAAVEARDRELEVDGRRCGALLVVAAGARERQAGEGGEEQGGAGGARKEGESIHARGSGSDLSSASSSATRSGSILKPRTLCSSPSASVCRRSPSVTALSLEPTTEPAMRCTASMLRAISSEAMACSCTADAVSSITLIRVFRS